LDFSLENKTDRQINKIKEILLSTSL
jgi:hypothetical protein